MIDKFRISKLYNHDHHNNSERASDYVKTNYGKVFFGCELW